MTGGLRPKLALALVATSALTLVAAMAALVPPLEHRIAADRLHDLRALAGTARLALARMPASDLRPGATRQVRFVRDLERRTGAHVALLDARGAALADTDPDEPVTGRPAQRPRSAVEDGVAVVVAPVATRAGRRTLVLRKSLRDSQAAVAVVRAALPVAAAAGLCVALALAVGLSIGLLRRLERLRRDARRLADEGIEQPLELRAGHDEVDEVAAALERMRARLHAEEQGRQAFLSTASHELRTPLASLQGTVELLREALEADAPDLAAARRRAKAAERQIERLGTLAADLLELRRVDSEAPLAAEPVDLVELAATMAGEAEARARAGGVAITVGQPGAEAPWALGDPPAIARILRALIDNALRYGGGRVTISLTVEGTVAAVHVIDEGPGIAEEERERIFGRFERGAAGAAAPGFGLGLPLARGLARRLGGDVRVVDCATGARFALTLPACPAPAEIASAGPPVEVP